MAVSKMKSDQDGVDEKADYDDLVDSLPRFSRELDRYKQSNRAGAKIGNALLKDVGVVHEDNLQLRLCPAKVMRQRDKFGGIAAEAHDDKPPPGMLKLF